MLFRKENPAFPAKKNRGQLPGAIPLIYRYDPPVHGKNSRPARVTLELASASRGAFVLEPETDADATLRAHGLSDEATSGQPEIDRRFHTISSDDRALKNYLNDASVRSALLALGELGKLDYLRHGRRRLRLRFQPPSLRGSSLEAWLQRAAPLSQTLARGAESPFQVTDTAAADRFDRIHAVFQSDTLPVLLSLAGAASLMGLGIAYAEWEPVHAGEAILRGGGALAVSLVAVLLMLRSTLRSLRLSSKRTATWTISVIMLLVGLGGGGALWLNGTSAETNVREEEFPILETFTRRHKNSTSYYARVPYFGHAGLWAHDDVDIHLTHDEFQRAVPGQSRLRVRYGDGILGFSTIFSTEFVEGLQGSQSSRSKPRSDGVQNLDEAHSLNLERE
jgi:hypothetical protein